MLNLRKMLENILFPEITDTPESILAKYPKRPEWMVVTRMAPSPTWFLHIGAIYSAMLDKIVAYKNNGVFMLRIEDTDQKREIQGAAEKFVDIFKIFLIECKAPLAIWALFSLISFASVLSNVCSGTISVCSPI